MAQARTSPGEPKNSLKFIVNSLLPLRGVLLEPSGLLKAEACQATNALDTLLSESRGREGPRPKPARPQTRLTVAGAV